MSAKIDVKLVKTSGERWDALEAPAPAAAVAAPAPAN